MLLCTCSILLLLHSYSTSTHPYCRIHTLSLSITHTHAHIHTYTVFTDPNRLFAISKHLYARKNFKRASTATRTDWSIHSLKNKYTQTALFTLLSALGDYLTCYPLHSSPQPAFDGHFNGHHLIFIDLLRWGFNAGHWVCAVVNPSLSTA